MKRPPVFWHHMLTELGEAGQRRAPVQVKRHHFNPRPAGVIRPGSASSKVLQHLQAHPGRHFQRHQIMLATGCTEQAVDWALSFLRAQGLIAAVGDPLRNPRYLRYSIRSADEPAAPQSLPNERTE